MNWVYLLSPALDRRFLAGADAAARNVIDAHGKYLDALRERGALLLAGRCWDGPYGIVMLNAPDREAAEAMVAADPTVMAGLQHAELYEFDIPYPPVTAATA
jgi:uncharacterized protein YciI